MREVPVGAVVVHEGSIIARAHNLRESERDPLAHAEILAIRKAAAHLGRWRLFDCILVVTLEPCAMCAGAIVNSRIETLVYGAQDPKAGAAGSVIDVLRCTALNHRPQVVGGMDAEACAEVLKTFFAGLRV